MRTTARLVVLALLGCATAPTPSNGKPNFILILADDMGYGDSSAYGGWVETPNLERMAREGLRFTDFHTSGVVCSPTRAGLLTGRYQQRAGIPGVINADPKQAVHHTGLKTRETTFAELLRDAGYATGIFGKWHLGYDRKFNPLHHGFDRFRGFVSGNIDYISHVDRMETYDWWEGLDHVKEEGYLTQLVNRHAIRFIERHKDRPFCLYVPHGAVHSPIQAPGDSPIRGPGAAKGTRIVTRTQQETVRLMFQAMDEGIGQILDAVNRLGLAERTLVIFLSDNGGARHCKNHPLRGGKGSVWEGGHRVPALFWWPGCIAAGRRSDDLGFSLDLMPTMLDLAGVAAPADRPLDGISLAPLLLESRPLPRRRLFWNGVAMRDGPWKLVARARGIKAPTLFNVAEDIGEKTDLAARHPDRVKEMLAAIEAWKADVAEATTPR